MMIDLQTAEQIALRFLNDSERNRSGHRIVIFPKATIEKEYGWVFFSNIVTDQQNHDGPRGLMGIGPLLVEKFDRSAHYIVKPTPGISLEISLAEYEACRGLPAQRPEVLEVYQDHPGTLPDLHWTIDQRHTLCGQPVPGADTAALTSMHSVFHTCRVCEQRGRELGLICPNCDGRFLSATDPAWCWLCRLKRRVGLL